MVKNYIVLISLVILESCIDMGYNPIAVNYGENNLVLDFGENYSKMIIIEPCQMIDLGDPIFIYDLINVNSNGIFLYRIDVDNVISKYNKLDKKMRKHAVLSVDDLGYAFDLEWYDSKCISGEY